MNIINLDHNKTLKMNTKKYKLVQLSNINFSLFPGKFQNPQYTIILKPRCSS